ncbi:MULTISPECIES: hypothetical protein [Lactobacillus]|uniref:Uncharacterized protein n=1 Tax=Lactobacillus xujianguonis TaxID=2495899 RepID=A0A437SS88_9LACO|nr:MULTISPECIES: hypothetical protein [Lactobacillus]RVU69790.1 hypothetical protein EJK17_11225 [Lactobacillus xujianguonis]RVU71898.1 hypothetical protein EJK20_11370 [Lactobacillus xujianguonis]
MLQPLTKDQMKEVKYQQSAEAMRELALSDPDAIIVYLPNCEAIICEDGFDYDYGFESASEFLHWRLSEHDYDLNALSDEMGYDTPSPNHGDFLDDYQEYADDLEEFILDRYSSDRLGDLYDE